LFVDFVASSQNAALNDMVPDGHHNGKSTIHAKGALARASVDEIADDERAHRLRTASFKFQRRLHDIEAAYFEAQATARSEYLTEVEAVGGADD
jgi:hypothetical protein